MAFHLYEYEHSSIRDIYHGFWHYAPLNILAIAFNFCRAHCQLMAKNSVLPNVIATLSTVRLANNVTTRWLPWLLLACIPSCVKPYLCTTAMVRSCRTSSNVFFFLVCLLVTASSNSPSVLVSHFQSHIWLHVLSYFAMGCTGIAHPVCSLFCFSVANDK